MSSHLRHTFRPITACAQSTGSWSSEKSDGNSPHSTARWDGHRLIPELMIRMLIVGYCFGIRSERRLCEEVDLNVGYRWFCRLGLDGDVPDHSTFSKNRHGRFRESDLLRRLFETVLQRCIAEGLVGGEAFATRSNIGGVDHDITYSPTHRQMEYSLL